MNLSIVVVEALGAPEEPLATLAVVMFIEAVFQQVLVIIKVLVTLTTESVIGTIDPMFPEI